MRHFLRHLIWRNVGVSHGKNKKKRGGIRAIGQVAYCVLFRFSEVFM